MYSYSTRDMVVVLGSITVYIVAKKVIKETALR
jgi:hypothetical protein